MDFTWHKETPRASAMDNLETGEIDGCPFVFETWQNGVTGETHVNIEAKRIVARSSETTAKTRK